MQFNVQANIWAEEKLLYVFTVHLNKLISGHAVHAWCTEQQGSV